MSSHYHTDVVFPAALEEAFNVMKNMKRNIENYKLRNDAKQSWIDRQENSLAKLMYFIEASRETIELLQKEYNEARKEGFKSGKIQAEKEFKHKEEYGTLRFDNPNHKERIRAASVLNAQKKWNF